MVIYIIYGHQDGCRGRPHKKTLTRNIKGEGVQDKLDVKNTRTATDRRQQYDSKILSTNDNQYDEFNP